MPKSKELDFFKIHAALLLHKNLGKTSRALNISQDKLNHELNCHTYNGEHMNPKKWLRLSPKSLSLLDEKGQPLLCRQQATILKNCSMKDIHPLIRDCRTMKEAANQLFVPMDALTKFFAVFNPITLATLNDNTSKDLERDYEIYTELYPTRRKRAEKNLSQIYELAAASSSINDLGLYKLGIESHTLTRNFARLGTTYEYLKKLTPSEFTNEFRPVLNKTLFEAVEIGWRHSPLADKGLQAAATTPMDMLFTPQELAIFPLPPSPSFSALVDLGDIEPFIDPFAARAAELDEHEARLKLRAADLARRETHLAQATEKFEQKMTLLGEARQRIRYIHSLEIESETSASKQAIFPLPPSPSFSALIDLGDIEPFIDPFAERAAELHEQEACLQAWAADLARRETHLAQATEEFEQTITLLREARQRIRGAHSLEIESETPASKEEEHHQKRKNKQLDVPFESRMRFLSPPKVSLSPPPAIPISPSDKLSGPQNDIPSFQVFRR